MKSMKIAGCPVSQATFESGIANTSQTLRSSC